MERESIAFPIYILGPFGSNGRMHGSIRLLGWTLFLGLLLALGFVTFFHFRQQPRWSLAGNRRVAHLAADGSRLITLSADDNGMVRGPIQVWDTQTGEDLHGFVPDSDWLRWEMSPDRRLMAVVPNDGTVRLIDWQAGVERVVSVEAAQFALHLEFSRDGQWLLARLPAENVVVDVPQAKLALLQRPEEGQRPDEFLGFDLAQQQIYFGRVRNDLVSIWSLRTGARTQESEHIAEFVALADGVSWLARASGAAEYKLHAGNGSRHTLDVRASESSGIVACDTRHVALRHDATTPSEKAVSVFEIGSGKKVFTVAVAVPWKGDMLGNLNIGDVVLDESSVVIHDCHRFRLLAFDLASGRKLWETPSCEMRVLPDNSRMILNRCTTSASLELLEIPTGRCRALPVADADQSTIRNMTWTPDGRTCVIRGQIQRTTPVPFWEHWLKKWWPKLFDDARPTLTVIDTRTGATSFRIENRGRYEQLLSDDGGILAALDEDPTTNQVIVRIWDVRPYRAICGAVCATAVIGLGLWSLRRGVSRLVMREYDRSVPTLIARLKEDGRLDKYPRP